MTDKNDIVAQTDPSMVIPRHSLNCITRFRGNRQALRLMDRQYSQHRRRIANARWPVLHSTCAVEAFED